MKRHPALAALSRDHHGALRLARTLEAASEETGEGADCDPQPALDALRQAWEPELVDHFAWEERWFGRFLADTAEFEQMLAEHRTVREGVEALLSHAGALASDTDVRLSRVGAVLRAHVRWEERVLFPFVERSVSDDDLAQMLAAQPARASEA